MVRAAWRRRRGPEAFKARHETRKILYETHRKLLNKRYHARKALYEQQREARLKRGGLVDFGVASVREPIGERGGYRLRSTVGGPPSLRPRTVRLEPEERPPLIDVIDEGEHLRVDVQLHNIPWPEDIVSELKEVSFRHGVLELRLKRRKQKGLAKEEKEALESAEKVTSRVKEKLLLKLKKPLLLKLKKPEKAQENIQKP